MYFFQHDAGELEAKAAYDAIMAGDMTTGHQVELFEKKLVERFGFANVATANSGTSALHLALLCAGVGPGDEVITTPYVGVWTANPILMVGATPVFADIDRDTYNLDPAAVEQKLTSRTKAVMPVSVNGVPCDYRGLRRVLPDHVTLICDDIEALGSTRFGKYVGEDMQGSDISVHGFWVSKQVTTCSGGAIASADSEIVDKFRRLTRHGHGRIGDMWEQSFGYNVSLVDPLAAIGIVQIDRLGDKQALLGVVHDLLDQKFASWPHQRLPRGFTKTHFVYMIELPYGVDKRQYAHEMDKLGIPTRPYFNSLLDVPHLKPYASPCPVATMVASRTVALPFHWKITKSDVDEIFLAHTTALRVCQG